MLLTSTGDSVWFSSGLRPGPPEMTDRSHWPGPCHVRGSLRTVTVSVPVHACAALSLSRARQHTRPAERTSLSHMPFCFHCWLTPSHLAHKSSSFLLSAPSGTSLFPCQSPHRGHHSIALPLSASLFPRGDTLLYKTSHAELLQMNSSSSPGSGLLLRT